MVVEEELKELEYTLSGIETCEDISYNDLKVEIHWAKTNKQNLYADYKAFNDELKLEHCRKFRTLQKLARKKMKQLYPARKK
jgi:hypothetical protein